MTVLLNTLNTEQQSRGRGVREAARPTGAARTGGARPRLDDCLVSLTAPGSLEAELYRSLRHRMERLRSDTGLAVLGVTSAALGDGKTTTAINLAGALAQAATSRVLLIDADLHRPAVGRRLGLDNNAPGLVRGAVDSRLELSVLVRHCSPYNLSVLLGGRCTNHRYEVLNSPRVGELLGEARRQYDFVVVDLPPVLVLPDCGLVTQWVDGFLLVVAAHKTPRKLLEDALESLEPAKVVGLVFNGDDRPLSGYYSYYQAYGSSRGNGKSSR